MGLERDTYDFLQAVHEVANDDAEALELLEEGAELLTGALTQGRAQLLRLLADEVGGDDGTHVHDLGTPRHCVRLDWEERERAKEDMRWGRERET